MPAIAPDDGKKKEKQKFANSSDNDNNQTKVEISQEFRSQIYKKVGSGFNKIDIHTIIPQHKYRVNCWKSEGEGLSTQWKIDKSLWCVFENGQLTA